MHTTAFNSSRDRYGYTGRENINKLDVRPNGSIICSVATWVSETERVARRKNVTMFHVDVHRTTKTATLNTDNITTFYVSYCELCFIEWFFGYLSASGCSLLFYSGDAAVQRALCFLRQCYYEKRKTRSQHIWQQRNVAPQLINLWLTAILRVFDGVIANRH